VTAVAWLVLPLVFYLIAAGLGLLAERLARVELPDALLAPLGACLAIVLVLTVLELGGAGAAMGIVLVVLAVAGMVLSRDRLRSRLVPGWAGVAALLVFVLYMAPVVLSGHWNWLGYSFVNDTANNFIAVDHLAEHGSSLSTAASSTRLHGVNGTVNGDYPLGAHGLLAALEWLVPAPVEAIYQPFIATIAALAAMALAWLAMSVGLPGSLAAVAAGVALGANLTYQYALHGAFKELSLVLIVGTAAAVSRFALDRRLPMGATALLGACLAAGIGVFSAGAGAYAAGMAAVVLLAIAVERPRQQLGAVTRGVATGATALVVAVSPIWLDVLSFSRQASVVFADSGQDLSAPLASPAVLGHLARPLPLFQSLGVWLRDDYRYPLAPGFADSLTTILLIVAGLLVAAAVVVELRRRRLGVLLAVIPALLVYLLSKSRLEPYAEAKLLVVLSPMVVFGATLGAWWLYRRLPIAGVVAALALVGGVVVSDAMAYRDVRLAPLERLEALRDASEHAAGRGPWLFPEWEEFAKHFGDAAALNVGSESFSPRPVVVRDNQPIFNRSFDLDEMALDYVLSWPGIMLRRSPETSRPPVGYELTYRNAYYELWERRSGPRVVEHLPLQRMGQPAVPPRCTDVTHLAERARERGQRLVAARRPTLPTLGMTRPPIFGAQAPDRTPSWAPDADIPGAIVPNGQGRIAGRLTVPAGTYRVWLKGGSGRPLRVDVDGRSVGSQRQINTPGQWLPYGEVELAGGRHELDVFRPGGGLEPGNGVDGLVAGVALEPQTARTLVDVAPRDARRLCGHPWDWIERVAG